MSPTNLSCGILCLVLCGKKPEQFEEKFRQYTDKKVKQREKEKYLKSLIAKAFLNGNLEHEHLKGMVVIPASLKDNYGYQSYTEKGLCLKLQQRAEDYL